MKEKLKNKLVDLKFDAILFFVFITAITFIYATYAWFSSTLNVEIRNFRVKVDTDVGLSISLDGINWTDAVDINEDSIISNLEANYPTNTNQWARKLNTVSTVGSVSSEGKFAVYGNDLTLVKEKFNFYDEVVNATLLNENKSSNHSQFVAFDLFFRNNTGSPFNDNLYLKGEKVFSASGVASNVALSAIRLGMIFTPSVNKKSPIGVIQNLDCSSGCSSFIYEENSRLHEAKSIDKLKSHDIFISNGVYYPTFAVYNPGKNVRIWSGIENSGISFDDRHFRIQETRTELNTPIYSLPDGIVKARIYIWIEAQDIDVIEDFSDGYDVSVLLNFEKDLAGFQ